MTPSESQNEFDKVREHLQVIRYILHLLTTSEPVELCTKHCPKCGQKTLYLWLTPSIKWSKYQVELVPQEILQQSQGFKNILDGQCYNPLGTCEHSIWPFLTRMDSSLLNSAPANGKHTHGSKLSCPYCKKPTFWGSARDGKIVAGYCASCYKPYLLGESGRSRWKLFLALHRQQLKLMIKERILFRQILIHRLNQPRNTIHRIQKKSDKDKNND